VLRQLAKNSRTANLAFAQTGSVQAAQAKLSAQKRGLASIIVKLLKVTPKVIAHTTVIRHLNAQLTCVFLRKMKIMDIA
jgi:hypothetical protein